MSEMNLLFLQQITKMFLMLLLAMLALACFNIWRKVRRKTRNMY